MITPINIETNIPTENSAKTRRQISENKQDYKSFDKSYITYSNAISSLGRAEISFQGKIKIPPTAIEKLVSEYSSGKSLKDAVLVLSGLGIILSLGHASKLLHAQPDWTEIEKQHIANNQTAKAIVTDELRQAVIKDYCEGEIPANIAKNMVLQG